MSESRFSPFWVIKVNGYTTIRKTLITKMLIGISLAILEIASQHRQGTSLLINHVLFQILFLLGPGFLTLIFTVLGYGYSQLDSNGTNTFLGRLYTMDMSQFHKLHEENTPLIQVYIFANKSSSLNPQLANY